MAPTQCGSILGILLSESWSVPGFWFLVIGPGGGTYDAVDSYLTVKPYIWELMDDWVLDDAASIAVIQEQFFEPVDHGSSNG